MISISDDVKIPLILEKLIIFAKGRYPAQTK